MFQGFGEIRGPTRPQWRPGTFGVALILHLFILYAIVAGTRSAEHGSREPPLKVTFLTFSQRGEFEEVMPATSPTGSVDISSVPATIPAAAAPEVPAEQAPRVSPPVTRPLAEILQPQAVPEAVSTGSLDLGSAAAMAEADGDRVREAWKALSEGLRGGVTGGIPGGIPGGVIGGQPLPRGPLRAGGAVSAPVVLDRVRPEYPIRARAARVEGAVKLEAIILSDGTVGQVRVLQGLRLGCTDAAIEALRHWRFKPGERYGVPVDVYFELTVEFILG